MNYFFILLSFLLILFMGCIGGNNSAGNAQGGSLDSIDDSDFAIVDPGFEDDNVTPVEVSVQ
jgi:hypothetical protein